MPIVLDTIKYLKENINVSNVLIPSAQGFHYTNPEHRMLLKENNISDDYLEPNYECKLCKDTGYIQTETSASTLCPCLKQKLLDISYNKSNISNLSKENFETFNPNIFSDKIEPEKYRLNISPRQNIITIKTKCMEFVKK